MNLPVAVVVVVDADSGKIRSVDGRFVLLSVDCNDEHPCRYTCLIVSRSFDGARSMMCCC